MLGRAIRQGLRRQVLTAVSAGSAGRAGLATAASKDYVNYPRDLGPGVDVKLNWSLNADDVTPSGAAHRNAEPAVLSGAKGAKAPSSGEAKILEAGDSVDFDTFDAALADIKAKLESTDLFVEDGTAKAAPGFGVRIIADSPAYALAAKQLLNQDKVGWPFTKSVTVYAAAGAKAFAGVQFEGQGGSVSGAVVALGAAPPSAIKTALSTVGQAMAEKK